MAQIQQPAPDRPGLTPADRRWSGFLCDSCRLRGNILPLAAIAGCFLLLKWFYARAGAEDLKWILEPTATLVGILTGKHFVYEQGAGYFDFESLTVIAPSCSGMNFLMAAFTMLAFLWSTGQQQRLRRWLAIPAAGLAAYAATIFVNTARICIAMELQQSQTGLLGFTPSEIHRMEGITLYFGSLLVLFSIAKRPIRFNRVSLLLPLVVYLTVTIVVPWANGSGGTPRFREHAARVLAVSVFLTIATHVATREKRNRPGRNAL